MTMIIVPRYSAMWYDGTNGEELANWIGTAVYKDVAEDGTLTITVQAYEFTYDIRVPPQRWVLRGAGMYQGSLTAEEYAVQYYELPGT
ncbi:hypothetical protein [Streptomyces nitrosporeus]|uniref:hypothetical protein n=1 Tax=Streptomyces nitrosporeus TaxID=28894 RepID=UPI0039A2B434